MSLLGAISLTFIYFCMSTFEHVSSDNYTQSKESLVHHKQIIERYYEKRKLWKTSNLGSILFKNMEYPRNIKNDKNYIILIWKHWKYMARLITGLSSEKRNALEGCSVNNCKFIRGNKVINSNSIDGVIFNLFYGQIPKLPKSRNPSQTWVFLTDESPYHVFAGTRNKPKLSLLANRFNWSMTYRSDSDVPIPYGRTVPLAAPVFPDLTGDNYYSITDLVPYWERKSPEKLITVLMSNCKPQRVKFVNMLWKYVDIDFYGKCSRDASLRNVCPGHYKADCNIISDYLFYLSLENSDCRQYMSEKIFYNAYSKGAIPIIKGPPLEDCVKLLPPHSFLHVEQFARIKDLAKKIMTLSKNYEKLLSYHLWRNHFNITNEHGWFGSQSKHLCRICEAMNYNDMSANVYDEDGIRMFLDQKIACGSPLKKVKKTNRRVKYITPPKKTNKHKNA